MNDLINLYEKVKGTSYSSDLSFLVNMNNISQRIDYKAINEKYGINVDYRGNGPISEMIADYLGVDYRKGECVISFILNDYNYFYINNKANSNKVFCELMMKYYTDYDNSIYQYFEYDLETKNVVDITEEYTSNSFSTLIK